MLKPVVIKIIKHFLKPEFLQLLQCPTCKSKLSERENSLLCQSCNRSLHSVIGIPIFISQEELGKFFTEEPIGKYFSTEITRSIVESPNYVDSLEKVARFVGSDNFQKHYEAEACNWAGNLNNEIELAAKRARKIISEKVYIGSSNFILDWPTGSGCLLHTLLDKVHKDAYVILVDINFAELASLKIFLERKGKTGNILFVNCDARAMPFADNVFQAITAWGGLIEVPDSCRAVKESFRVLASGGWFAGGGEVYQNNSRSMTIANNLGIGSLTTRFRIEKCLVSTGFRNIFFESLYEGHDESEPDPGRGPLPAYGDWFRLVVAGGQK